VKTQKVRLMDKKIKRLFKSFCKLSAALSFTQNYGHYPFPSAATCSKMEQV